MEWTPPASYAASSCPAVLAALFLFPSNVQGDQLIVTTGLALDIRFTRINGGPGEHAAYLYDGDVLLGTVTNTVVGNSYVEVGTFMSHDSLFFAGPDRQTVVDMGSILTGDIDGRLLVTISRGSLIIDSSDIRGTVGMNDLNSVVAEASDAKAFDGG